jgi:hypothetical protein
LRSRPTTDRLKTLGAVAVCGAIALIVLINVVPPAVKPAGSSADDFDVGGPVGEAGQLPSGEMIWIGTNTLNVVSDARATLVKLAPLGLSADIPFDSLYMPIAGTDGALGEEPDSAVPPANRRNARPMAGVVVSKRDGYFQLVVRLVLPTNGLSIHGYVLTYQVGSETRDVFIAHSQHVCPVDPTASACGDFVPYR